jgi:hypothetical protein
MNRMMRIRFPNNNPANPVNPVGKEFSSVLSVPL